MASALALLGGSRATAVAAAIATVPCSGTNTADVAHLIAAITAADAGPGPQLITLAPGCTFTLSAVGDSSDGSTGLPVISNAITIDGGGDTITRSTARGTPRFRLIDVSAGGSLALNALHLTNGDAGAGGGGAVLSRGPLTASGCTFDRNTAGFDGGALLGGSSVTISGGTMTGNTAGLFGGAVFASAALAVRDTTFARNGAALGGGAVLATGPTAVTDSSFLGNHGDGGDGGGLLALSTSAVTVAGSTLVANSATLGGGVAVNGSAAIINSTFAANTATSGGAVFANAGRVAVLDSTISANHASNPGGGIVTAGGTTTTVTNSIVVDNIGSNCGAMAGAAPVIDGGHDDENGTSCGFGRNAVHADPALGPLQTNGGPTMTMAITTASAAYAGGDPGVCAAVQPGGAGGIDQRGVTRKTVVPCDIGAYEVTVVVQPSPGPSGVAGLSTTVATPSTGAAAGVWSSLILAALVTVTGLAALITAATLGRRSRREPPDGHRPPPL